MRYCDIQTRNDLADWIGIEHGKLTYVLYVKKTDTQYTEFQIPKKDGEMRNIYAPKNDLKKIQRYLARALWQQQQYIWETLNIDSKISHAFQKDRSIITNSIPHRKKRFIVNIDLEDFFPSINFGRVRGFFINNKYWKTESEVATVIAQLTCYKGALPQGAPTSPVISNMICNIMDMRIVQLAQKYKLTYTRYADDLTFSTNEKSFLEAYPKFYKELTSQIEKSGFRVNQKKTRMTFKNSRQEVTGLVVNQKISVKREFFRNTHAMAHKLYIEGQFEINGEEGTVNQLEGRFAFIDQIDKYNNSIDGKKHSVQCLSHREQKYQEFLYYKLFCMNTKPLIITEGKTDILYLKSALKKLYMEYPHLISKENDKWVYHVDFLHRTEKLRYYFNMGLDGADAMIHIYNLYRGHGNSRVNYYDLFTEKYHVEVQTPVVLLFDNELESKDKPIKKIIGNQQNAKEQLEKKNIFRSTGNLYIQVIPLSKGQKQSEMEDLFDDSILNLIIDGRTLDRSGKKDKSQFYNKDVLSKYVYANYENINFEKFKPLFDVWEKMMGVH